jgi:hypothetical protein
MLEHFENGIFLRFDTNISQNAVLRIKKFAETLKEHHMTGKFALIFMFYTEEHVIEFFSMIGFFSLIPLRIFNWPS